MKDAIEMSNIATIHFISGWN